MPYNFPSSWLQFSHSWKVEVQVKPIPIIAQLVALNFIFSGFAFSPPTLLFIGGNGINAMIKPSITIKAIVITNSVRNDIFAAATIPIAKGNTNCPIEIENLVNMLAIAPFFVKISKTDGVTAVSKNEFLCSSDKSESVSDIHIRCKCKTNEINCV